MQNTVQELESHELPNFEFPIPGGGAEVIVATENDEGGNAAVHLAVKTQSTGGWVKVHNTPLWAKDAIPVHPGCRLVLLHPVSGQEAWQAHYPGKKSFHKTGQGSFEKCVDYLWECHNAS